MNECMNETTTEVILVDLAHFVKGKQKYMLGLKNLNLNT